MKQTEKLEQGGLKQVVHLLITNFNIEEIYLHQYNRETPICELIVLISNKYIQNLEELLPEITHKIKDFPDYRIRCYVAFQAKDKIREGNLLLHACCQPDKRIYKKEGSEFTPIPLSSDGRYILDLVTSLREKEQRKIDEFTEGYFCFVKRGKLPLASFMLHQSMELTYRYLERLLIGKERITHSIRMHHRCLQQITSLSEIFNESDSGDARLLKVLENIYLATRYEDQFSIETDTLKRLEKKMELLHRIASRIYEHIISAFENQQRTIVSDKSDPVELTIHQTTKNKPKHIEKIIDQVRDYLSTEIDIYLFGQRERSFHVGKSLESGSSILNEHFFDLLLITESDLRNQVTSLEAMINQHDGVHVLVISFTQDQAQHLLDNNNPFLHRVLEDKSALQYAGIDKGDWRFHENGGVRNQEQRKRTLSNWKHRWHNAWSFLQGGKSIKNSDGIMAKVFLYNQALEQCCLAMLEFFQGYTPYQYNLHHLYGMCSSFWRFPNDIFPSSTIEERRLFGHLAQAVKNTRYRRNALIEWNDVYRYDERCQRFLMTCDKLIGEQLENSSERRRIGHTDLVEG